MSTDELVGKQNEQTRIYRELEKIIDKIIHHEIVITSNCDALPLFQEMRRKILEI